MGCDIHLCTERKFDNKWINTDYWQLNPLYPHREENQYEQVEVYSDRNYGLFSILAGVRSDGTFIPIDNPRGLPKDMTIQTKEYLVDYWDNDGHSHSYLYLDELYNYWINTPEEIERQGILIGDVLKDFDVLGKEPRGWCMNYNGVEHSGLRTWKMKFDIMDDFMKTLLVHWNCSCWDWMTIDIIKKDDNIKKFIKDYGKEYRIVFCFDN